MSSSALCVCPLTLHVDVTTTERPGPTETTQPGGIENHRGIVECTEALKKGAVVMGADATVGGTEMETITETTTGWTAEELIMTEAPGTTSEVPGRGERRRGREEQNISCKKLAGENMRQIKSL